MKYDDNPTVEIGAQIVYAKTITETDVYMYAGVTGDFSPNHIDEAYMSEGRYGHRIAHGTLMMGLMSAASARLRLGRTVSLGYDRVRLTGALLFGDTITTTYTLTSIDREKRRAYADVQCVNQNGKVVAVATNVRAWVD